MPARRRPAREEGAPVLLLCNGEPPSRALARRYARISSRIVAADGGANAALRLGLTPDVIIGDLDSVRPATLAAFSRSRVIRVRRQDNTDLEKALDLLVAEKEQSVIILGAAGRRLDFTLGNLSVLWAYADRLEIVVAGDGWHAAAVGKARTVNAAPGTTVSLIPFGACRGVTLRGLKYPLTDADFTVGEIAVSNEVRRSPFRVAVKRGALLLVVMADAKGQP